MSRPSAKVCMPYTVFIKADWRRQKKQHRYHMSPVDVAGSEGTYDGMYGLRTRTYPPGRRADMYDRNRRIADTRYHAHIVRDGE